MERNLGKHRKPRWIPNSVLKFPSKLSQLLRPGEENADLGLRSTASSWADQKSAMREAQQICSGNDDLTYTKGPLRIVHASDGMNHECAALLINARFNNSVKAAIRAKEDLEGTLRIVRDQDAASNSLRYQLQDSFSDSRARVAQLLANAAHAVRDQYTEEGIALRIALKVVNEDFGKIDDALRKESNERQDRYNILQSRFTDFCEQQGPANDFLERAFIHARLLPSQEQSSTSQKSGQSKCDEQNGLKRNLNVTVQERENRLPQEPSQAPTTSTVTASNIVPPPRISELHPSSLRQTDVGTIPPPRIPEVALAREYRNARKRRIWAQREFDARMETRGRDERHNKRALKDPKDDNAIPLEEFDLGWMLHIAKLTRKLINAESGYRTARVIAIEAGCSVNDSNASSIFDNRTAGYATSLEERLMGDAPAEMIESWRRKLPGVFESPESSVDSQYGGEEGDDDSIMPWDSWSTIAMPRDKVKIEEWQKVCAGAGKQSGRMG